MTRKRGIGPSTNKGLKPSNLTYPLSMSEAATVKLRLEITPATYSDWGLVPGTTLLTDFVIARPLVFLATA